MEIHAPYLEAAWSSQAAFAEKRFPSLAAARAALLEITQEVAEEGAGKLIETLVSQSIPCMGLLVSLGKWGAGKVKEKTRQSELVAAAGALQGQERDDLLLDTVSTLSRLSRPGLPLVVFIEDLHRASALTQELVERLVRTNASILILSTTWSGTLDDVERFSKLFHDPVISERILRVQHDKALPAIFPPGASLSELDSIALQNIVKAYYPKADPETTRLLAERYNNPLPLELVCTLSKYRNAFEDGALKLSREEIETLPRKVERLYWELWEELPEAIQQVLALATLGIPKTDSAWHKPLVNHVIQQWANQDKYQSLLQVLDDHSIPHGWARLVEAWLQKFNEPDQLRIAKEYLVDDFLSQSQIDAFIAHIAQALSSELKSVFNESEEPDIDDQLMHKAWLVLSLHEENNVDDMTALCAILTIQIRFQAWPMNYVETKMHIGSKLDRLAIEKTHSMMLRARFHYISMLASTVVKRIEQDDSKLVIEMLRELLNDQVRTLGNNHLSSLRTKFEISMMLGQFDKGQQLEALQDLLDEQESALGRYHPDVFRTRNNIIFLNGLYFCDYKKVLAEYRILLSDLEKMYGPDHRKVLSTRYTIAHWLAESGAVDDALDALQILLSDQQRVLGEDDVDVYSTKDTIEYLRDSVT